MNSDIGESAINGNDFSERLKKAMGEQSVLAFSKGCGISNGAIRNMLSGGLPRLDNLLAISDYTGLSVEWLATGKESNDEHVAAVLGNKQAEDSRDRKVHEWNTKVEDIKKIVDQKFVDCGLHVDDHWKRMIASIAEKRGLDSQDIDDIASLVRSEAVISSEFALIPGYKVEVSAGPGCITENEKPTRFLAFRHKWLRYRQLKAENLVLVFARGDSMEPTIHDNNTLMIDTTQTALSDGNIYVIRTDDHLVVKRVQKLVNKGILLLSDNKEYKEQLLEANEANDLAVIGRVVWIGKDI